MQPFEPFAIFTAMEPLGTEPVAKAGRKPSGVSPESMVGRVGGFISDDERDFQGERILQKGCDWTYFLKHGWFNYEHRQGPDNILGHPERVYPDVRKGVPGTRVEGVLYLGIQKAKETYEAAVAMDRANSDRRVGYSVEGRVLSRDPLNQADVLKSQVLNVACTAHPINPRARMEILKGLAKAAVGYQTPSSGGNPLVRQSIEGVLANEAWGEEVSEETKRKLMQRVSKGRISLSDFTVLVQKAFALSRSRAETVAREIFAAIR